MANASLTFPTPGPASLTIGSLTRTDTGATVGGTITFVSGTTWTLSITEPVPSLTYAYTLNGTWADGSVGAVSGTVNTSVTNGYYWSLSGVDAFYGTNNVAMLSQLDNDATSLSLPVLQAHGNRVDNLINRKLREYSWSAPLPTTSADYPVFSDVANAMVGVLLYRARPEPGDAKLDVAMDAAWKAAMSQLLSILRSPAGIDGTRTASPAVTVYDPRVQAGADGYPSIYPRGSPYIWWGN